VEKKSKKKVKVVWNEKKLVGREKEKDQETERQ